MVHWPYWENLFVRFLQQQPPPPDPAHDLAHVRRVVANARRLAAAEGARLEIVLPAAWLHDCVTVPKHSPQRRHAATLAAGVAGDFLQQQAYPAAYIPAIQHAIEAHSFSAGITPRTLAAQVVQDADRLDALGAIGIARCLVVGAAPGRLLYDPIEPFPINREPDDTVNILDHFYRKLLKLPDMMQTATGRAEAYARMSFMRRFLQQLGDEIGAMPPS